MQKLQIVVFAALCATTLGVSAQTMKPGLWQVQSKMQGDAQMNAQLEQARKQMAAMPPEQRKMMEEMMAKRGVQLNMADGGTSVKICLTEEDVKRDSMPVDAEGKCKHDWKRSGNTIKATFSCTDPVSSGTGEWVITSAERYTMKMDMTSQDRSGKSRIMNMTGEGKWLGADCKGLVPASKANK